MFGGLSFKSVFPFPSTIMERQPLKDTPVYLAGELCTFTDSPKALGLPTHQSSLQMYDRRPCLSSPSLGRAVGLHPLK